MFSSYLNLAITIGPPGAAGAGLFIHGPGGDARGNLALPTDDVRYQALIERLQQLDTDEAELTELGQILFRALFQGSIKEVYTRSQGVLRDGQGLRLTLDIAASESAIAALPWEFLHDPDQGPLALMDVPIVRYLPQQANIPTLKIELPLKVLLTAASTHYPVDIERELREVQSTLSDLGDFVQITVEPHLTTNKLQKLLRSDEFHIWHFIGHGGFDRDGTTGRLAFEDSSGDVDFISAPQLGILLNRTSLRLVVLDACQGARLATDPFRSMAFALIRAQIPAVIAMQFSVPEETTRAFAAEFYRALGEGFPIDACVTEGRKAMMHIASLNRPDWGIPVVYIRTPDGALFDLPPLPKPPCPYPGMVPFRQEDAQFFYGREDEIERMYQHLRDQRLLIVIGSSGSGKSSLIRAGLLPRLLTSSSFPSGFWLICQMRPGSNPTATLAAIIRGDGIPQSRTPVELLAAHPPAQRVLLIIDQFEELFTHVDRTEQHRFIHALNILRKIACCTVVIAMRADFYPDLLNSDLWPIDASQRLEIAPLRGARLRQAIERPAQAVGVRLEPRLIDRLLADSADEPGVLPLIQETIALLWEKMVHRLLPLSVYERLSTSGRSGLAVAIATKADAALVGLSSTQQVISRRIFVRLVQFGEGRADTRRQQRMSELQVANEDPLLFAQTLSYLADHRLLTLSGEAEDPDRRIDIAHETLIDGWPALRHWLDERREAERIRRRLEEKAHEWSRLEGKGGLLDAVELQEAERWLESRDAADLGHSDMLLRLVQASRAVIAETMQKEQASHARELADAQALANEQSRAATNLRRLLVALSAVFLLAVAVAVYALNQRTAALAQARISLSRQLAGQSLALLNDKTELGLLLGVEAYRTDNNADTRGSLLAGMVDSPPLVAFLRGHHDWATGVAFSPDGTKLVSSSTDKTLVLWNLATRQPIGEPLRGHTGKVQDVVFSPDGTMLASGGDDRIFLWDVITRKPIAELGGPRGRLTKVAFSPDGRRLASGDRSGKVLMWDVATRQQIATIDAYHDFVEGLAFSPNGALLASSSCARTETQQDQITLCTRGEIRLWDVTAQRWLGQPLTNHVNRVSSLAFSPDGATLASGSWDQTIILWDVATRKPIGEPLRGHAGWVYALAFSPDGKTVVSGSWDKTVILWDVATRQAIGPPLRGHTDVVRSVAFSPDGTMLASSSQDNTIILWSRVTSQRIGTTLRGHTSTIESIVFSADGAKMFSSDDNGTILIWDVTHDQPQSRRFASSRSGVTSLALNQAGTQLASGATDGSLILWDVATGRSTPLPGHRKRVWSVAFSPDGKTLASGGEDGVVMVWNIASSQGTALNHPSMTIWCVAFSPDGKTLAAGGEDDTITFWDVTTGKLRGSPLHGHTNTIYDLAFNNAGTLLASGSRDRTIILWDVASQKLSGVPLTGFNNSVYAVAFSPDGQTLASGSCGEGDTNIRCTQGEIRLWDVPRRQLLGTPLTSHTDRVYSLAFSPIGSKLVSGGLGKTIILWDLDVDTWQRKICTTVSRNLTPSEWTQYMGDLPWRATCPGLP